MGVPPEFYLQFILSTFSIALTSVLGVLVYRLNRQYADRKEDEKRHLEKAQEDEKKRMGEYAALKDGLLAILRDRIIQADVHCSLKEGATVREKTNVQMMYASYHRLGGNSIATQSYEHVISLPILAEEAGT